MGSFDGGTTGLIVGCIDGAAEGPAGLIDGLAVMDGGADGLEGLAVGNREGPAVVLLLYISLHIYVSMITSHVMLYISILYVMCVVCCVCWPCL